ncbi:hypothetical protein LEN26_019867 [Aphanomyces euteiches]|nr:hypothetical protein LEN26_019867 [Aphanomyces euteiches]KAH9113195.1 hypothetical protein AeMF1_012567 [Aphanomyces euteiches]KAH9115304.1 hypothetical protein AeMF1_010629 [Aphanomyces euteiches]KAH9125801.1 hypothetical protein AeMF1_003650 [Aphanomyces euteiches]KAH9183988.1 hypothetical protein AeNC1_014037 [Aphanomyces euteiches]
MIGKWVVKHHLDCTVHQLKAQDQLPDAVSRDQLPQDNPVRQDQDIVIFGIMSLMESQELKRKEIERLTLALRREKLEMMSAIRSELPPNVGLIWMDDVNLDSGINYISGEWGDASMDTAWMKCPQCQVLSLTNRSARQLTGNMYSTDDCCKYCGSKL